MAGAIAPERFSFRYWSVIIVHQLIFQHITILLLFWNFTLFVSVKLEILPPDRWIWILNNFWNFICSIFGIDSDKMITITMIMQTTSTDIVKWDLRLNTISNEAHKNRRNNLIFSVAGCWSCRGNCAKN